MRRLNIFDPRKIFVKALSSAYFVLTGVPSLSDGPRYESHITVVRDDHEVTDEQTANGKGKGVEL